MKRIIEFKMERETMLLNGQMVKQVEIGQTVPIRESVLPNTVYYYVIEPAIGMSPNFPTLQRLKRADYSAPIFGTVVDIKTNERGFYVDVEFEEP